MQEICSSQRTSQINERIYERNIPSAPLQPYLDARPVLTKYSILPIVDYRAPVSVPLIQRPTYNPHQTFNPGNRAAPWSGFSSNICVESDLRNQYAALQSCPQAYYIPSSQSSLYRVVWENKSDAHIQQPFPDLFQQEPLVSSRHPNPDPSKIGYMMFQNATRQQMRGLMDN